jgi:small basic protein
MDTKMYLFKSTWITMITALSTVGAFIGSYFMNLTADNTEQYLAVIAVVLLDGFFGLCAGIKREGFKTYKAVKVLKTIFAWVLILTVILSVELGFTGTGWLSETILIPFIIFQLISLLKMPQWQVLYKTIC